jgi:hypothetical protein
MLVFFRATRDSFTNEIPIRGGPLSSSRGAVVVLNPPVAPPCRAASHRVKASTLDKHSLNYTQLEKSNRDERSGQHHS